jgi:hypothetical protein
MEQWEKGQWEKGHYKMLQKVVRGDGTLFFWDPGHFIVWDPDHLTSGIRTT